MNLTPFTCKDRNPKSNAARSEQRSAFLRANSMASLYVNRVSGREVLSRRDLRYDNRGPAVKCTFQETGNKRVLTHLYSIHLIVCHGNC